MATATVLATSITPPMTAAISAEDKDLNENKTVATKKIYVYPYQMNFNKTGFSYVGRGLWAEGFQNPYNYNPYQVGILIGHCRDSD